MIVDPDFPDHWKTRMLVGMLAGDEVAPVYVIRLWAHCQNRRKSQFENLTAEALKALCRFPGLANDLDAAMIAAGFISRNGNTLEVLNWSEYNASLIAAWNNGNKGGRPKKPDGFQRTTEVKPTGSREEKRREESNNATTNVVACVATENPSSTLAGTATDKSLLIFPCDGKPGSWSLTEALHDEWRELYPSLDIIGESRKALAWIQADSSRKKTAKGMQRFLVGWLNRSQDRGPQRQQANTFVRPPLKRVTPLLED